jgi:hypothetical protein
MVNRYSARPDEVIAQIEASQTEVAEAPNQ